MNAPSVLFPVPDPPMIWMRTRTSSFRNNLLAHRTGPGMMPDLFCGRRKSSYVASCQHKTWNREAVPLWEADAGQPPRYVPIVLLSYWFQELVSNLLERVYKPFKPSKERITMTRGGTTMADWGIMLTGVVICGWCIFSAIYDDFIRRV